MSLSTKLVADHLVRVLDTVGLAGGETRTIALHPYNATVPDVKLPAEFSAPVLGDVSLQDAIEVRLHSTDPTLNADAAAYKVVKTGTKHTNFLITITNTGTPLESPSTGPLEIYVHFH